MTPGSPHHFRDIDPRWRRTIIKLRTPKLSQLLHCEVAFIKPSVIRRMSAPMLLALAALTTAFGAGFTFHRATTPWSTLPDADYWLSIPGIITETGIKLDISALFGHVNEHIIVIPKLVYAANYLATSGNNIGLIIYSILVGALCSTLLLYLAKELFIETPLRFAFCALLFPLVMFSAKLTHNYFLGMSGAIWLTADLFVIASAAALGRAVATRSSIWFLTSLIAALLGALSYTTSMYALVFLLCFCLALLAIPALHGIMPRRMLMGAAMLIAAGLAIWIIYRNEAPYLPAWEFEPGRLFYFVLVYLGSAIPVNGPAPRAVAGLVIILVGAASIYRLTS